jgi:hypothetical protein
MSQALRGALQRLPVSTPEEKERVGRRSEAVAHLQNVKDAWRNDTMHPRAVYTEQQAVEILQHSKALMAVLASFLEGDSL